MRSCLIQKGKFQKVNKMATSSSKKKWLTLSIVGVALLLIPRRSSKKADRALSRKAKNKDSR